MFDLVSTHSSHQALVDNQPYTISTLDTIHQPIKTVRNCTTDVKSWMTTNKLQLNDNKTDATTVLSNHEFSFDSLLLSVIRNEDAEVQYVSYVSACRNTYAMCVNPHEYKLGISTIQYNITLLPSVNTLIARGMFCGAKYTHHTFTPVIKHLITTTANKHPGKKSLIDLKKQKQKNKKKYGTSSLKKSKPLLVLLSSLG